MNITCPQCSSSYTLPDDCIPKDRKSSVNCRKCNQKILLKHPASQQIDNGDNGTQHNLTGDLKEIVIQDETATGQQIFSAYPELRNLNADLLQFDEILEKAAEGGYVSKKNTFKIKIIKSVHNVLGNILYDNEQVLRVGKGTAYFLSEIFHANGLFTIFSNYYAIVCTNERILLININFNISRHTRYIFQIPYGNIHKAKRGLFRTELGIQTKDGNKFSFTSIKRNFSQELFSFIDKQMRKTPQPQTIARQPVPSTFCPSCYTPLSSGLSECAHCHVPFKNPKSASLKSMILPGWGAIYLGYVSLGIIELLFFVLLLFSFVMLLFSEYSPFAFIPFILLLLYNAIDSMVTFSLARRGYIVIETF